MATFAATDYMLILGGTTMSGMATEITLDITAAELENTAFGATYRSRIGGLKDGKLDVSWNEDFAAGQPDATLFPLLGTVATFEVRPTSGARSATNPAYTGSVLITQYLPLESKVGDLANFKTSWPTTGTILRQTS